MNSIPVFVEWGYEVLVLTSHGRVIRPEQSCYKGVSIIRFPFWKALIKKEISMIAKIQRQILELKEEFIPDLIHLDFLGFTAFFYLTTERHYPAPTLVSLHFDFSDIQSGPGTILRQTIQRADWVTAISNAVLMKTRKVIPEITRRSSTVYGFSGPMNDLPTPLPFEKPCILGLGRLVPEKGFDLLVDAIPAIIDHFPEFVVKIIGDGNERYSLERRVTALGLKERIKFFGNIPNEDVPSHINKATLVVIPSRWFEAFGIVAVEAALMARPAVASDVGGLAEIVIDGVTGLLFERGNIQALAGAIIKVLSNPGIATKMEETARSSAEQIFSLANYVDEYDRLYQNLVSSHSKYLEGKEYGSF